MPDVEKIVEVAEKIPELPGVDKKVLQKADKETFNKIKNFSIFFGILILILLGFGIANYKDIQGAIGENLAQQVESYGYPTVFITAFLVELLPQPFVSSLVPFTSGLVFGLDFTTLLILLLIGALSSNYLAYYLGIRYGKRVSIRLVGEENYENSLTLFKKYGKLGISMFALTPLPYFPILGGIFKMNLWEFTVYAIIPRIFHFLIASYIIILLF